MEGLLLIGGFIALIWVASVLQERIERWRSRRLDRHLEEALGPELLGLEDAVSTLRELEMAISEAEADWEQQRVRLIDSHGSSVSLCPKCGDTLRPVNTWRSGLALGCPNYPKCSHLTKISELGSNYIFDLEVSR